MGPIALPDIKECGAYDVTHRVRKQNHFLLDIKYHCIMQSLKSYHSWNFDTLLIISFKNYWTTPPSSDFTSVWLDLLIYVHQNTLSHRLNAEAEMRIQLSSIKPDIIRNLQKCKTMLFFFLIFLFRKYSSFNRTVFLIILKWISDLFNLCLGKHQ